LIFNLGDPGDQVFFIEDGQVAVFDPAAAGMPVRTFRAGDMFGELAVIDRQPRTLSARAESACRLWMLSTEDFEHVILENKAVTLHILVSLSESIRYTTDIFIEATRRSVRDALTGLYNRHLFESLIGVLEENRPPEVSVIMVDINGLKQVNDTQGHAAGDRLIRCVADTLRSAFRSEDAVARIGGDEFAIILPRVNADGAALAVERILSQTDCYNQQNPDFPISFAIGMATGQPDISIEDLIKQADAQMYKNKKSRRTS